MEIQVMIMLQQLRESVGDDVNRVFSVISRLSLGYLPLAAALLVFWVWDRQSGRRILGGYALGLFLNEVLKLSFCSFDPWIRKPRIKPWAEAVPEAGYAFPCEQAAAAGVLYGGVTLCARERHLMLSWGIFLLMVLSMFSRCYLGLNMMEGVLVGWAVAGVSLFTAVKVEDLADRKGHCDWFILAVVLVLCAAAAALFQYKEYPVVLDGSGNSIIDLDRIRAESWRSIGLLLFYAVLRIIERRAFRFDTELSKKARLIFGLIAIVPGYFLYAYTGPIVTARLGLSVGKFMEYGVVLLYGMLIVPLAMHIYARCRRIPKTERAA